MSTSDSLPNNPYIAGSPIKGQEMFFGRDDIFEKVRAHLVGEHQDNPIVMYGQRRTGKTSVLYQMGRRLNEYAGEERYVAVLVDLQGFALKSMDNFLLELAHRIRRELRDYKIKIPRPDKTAFKSDARQAFDNSFLPMVQTAIGTRRLLLMFDEAISFQEAVAKKKLEKEVFAYLRSLIQHGRHISFIFSLGSKIESLLPEYTLMLNVALTLHVSFLDEKAARSLVTEPVASLYSFDDDAIERLLALTSRHPYFTQVICHTLFTRWVEQPFRRVSVTDILTLAENEDAPGRFSKETLIDYYQKTAYTLNHLVRRGLVVEQHGKYNLFSTVFAEWIRNELHQTQSASQTYEEWLKQPPTQSRLKRLKNSVVGDVIERLLPAINADYRELMIGWLTNDVIVEKVMTLFGL